MTRTYIALPTGAKMNPAAPTTAVYYDSQQVAYILHKDRGPQARTRPTRVFTTFGAFDVQINDYIQLQHDQTGADLGEYRVVGVIDYTSNERAGNIPYANLAHCVAK